MNVRRPSGDTVIVSVDDNGIAYLFLLAFTVLAVVTVAAWLRDPGAFGTQRLQATAAGAGMALAAFLIFFERGRFVFDRHRREVRWHRRRALRARGGTIPFVMITDVAVQRPMGDEGVPSRRIVLVLADDEIPLSVGYKPDGNDVTLWLADELRRVVGIG